MSSDSDASHSSAQRHHEDEEGALEDFEDATIPDEESITEEGATSRNYLGEREGEGEELQSIGDGDNDLTFARVRSRGTQEDDEETASELSFRPKVERQESVDSASIPDDTPSIQGSRLSSPGSSVPVSHGSLRPHRPTSLQPFERRFSSRLSPSPLASPRAASPAFLSSHSRQSSLSSNFVLQQPDDADTSQAPWEVVRWTKLKKITGQVFSEIGKRNFGRPTCLNVAASLVIGTSKGFILVFDYQQVLKSIIGPGTKGIVARHLDQVHVSNLVCSCRMWRCHVSCNIRRPLDCRRWPCNGSYLHLGAGETCEAFPSHSTAGSSIARRPAV